MEGEQPSWNYPTFELNSASDCFFNPNFEHPMDQNDPLESALSSLVSSPAASNAGAGDGYVIRDVIGKLGSICNSGEVSPQSCVAGSRNTSCYNTPLNSPPKLNLSSVIESQIRGSFAAFGGENQLPSNLGLAPLNADPGFVERAAKFSCFGSRILGAQFGSELGYGSLPKLEPVILSRVSSAQEIVIPEKGDSREGSSVSEQNPGGESAVKPQINTNSRKRKSNPKPKAPVKEAKAGAENDESSNAKRSKSDEDLNQEKSNTDAEETKKEAPKDYIHVRARRGQATDSHSLAERVRREKISERMKFLQDLVPGCNKVTGKAVVLDEIINYVQSLQRQVEFLSMKLSTVNTRMDFNMEALLSKDMLQLPHNMLPLDSSAPVFPYSFQTTPFSVQLHSTDEFGGSATQIPEFWEDDLHSLVQMGFPQNQLQTLQGANLSAQMKIEQ